MPARDLFKAGSFERLHEGVGGESQIAIFFHIEIDELTHFGAIGTHEHFASGGAKNEF
jgi:ssDNA-specific exonuclease RecJ